jgi:hypothetical protein
MKLFYNIDSGEIGNIYLLPDMPKWLLFIVEGYGWSGLTYWRVGDYILWYDHLGMMHKTLWWPGSANSSSHRDTKCEIVGYV